MVKSVGTINCLKHVRLFVRRERAAVGAAIALFNLISDYFIFRPSLVEVACAPITQRMAPIDSGSRREALPLQPRCAAHSL